jgi:hypothetical protein
VLETVNGAFDLVALTINRLVKRASMTHVAAFGDGEANTPTTEQITDGFATVSLVPHNPFWTELGTTTSWSFDGPCGEQRRNGFGFMALARRQHQCHQASEAVGTEMDFSAKSTLAAT